MENNINDAFLNTLTDDSIKNISYDYLELGLDSFIDNELIKSIPIIKTLNGFYKFTKSIKAYYLTKKILRFLFQIKNVSKDEINKTLKKLESDKSYSRNLGENLILVIDRFDILNKSDLLGKAFKMFLKEQISYEEFLRVAHIIDRSFFDDLFKLILIQKSIEIDLIVQETLFSLGLLSLKPHEVREGMTGLEFMGKIREVDYYINNIGKLIIKVLENK